MYLISLALLPYDYYLLPYKHLETMNNFWGRAGGGNRNYIQKKSNLDNILFNQIDKVYCNVNQY